MDKCYETARDKINGMLMDAIDLLKEEFESIKGSEEPQLDRLLKFIDSNLDFLKKIDLLMGPDGSGNIRAGARINKKFN